jgi:hypothetical protein
MRIGDWMSTLLMMMIRKYPTNFSSIVVVLLLLEGASVEAFSLVGKSPLSLPNTKSLAILFRGRSSDDDAIGREDDDDDDEDYRRGTGIPQLPAATGLSSFGTNSVPSDQETTDERTTKTFVVGSVVATKFELQYTCNICETRNCHRVSRLAYRQGVVIARCKGCDSQHIIADNLGWTDYKGGFEGDVNDIEEFFANQGKEGVVNRVSEEVFHLEKIMHRDTKSGSIIGENGKLTME